MNLKLVLQEYVTTSAMVAHFDKAKLKMNLDKAANMMFACTVDEILSLDSEKQRQLNNGIRMILEVLSRK